MPAAENEKIIKTFCSLCGPSMGCGIECTVKDGKLVKIAGMQECPINRGKLCAKAFASAEWLYSPERLKYPMKRTGKKGEGKFRRITWDEAVAAIAEKLIEQKERYGPESLAVLSPQRRSYSDYIYRFLIAHGSPNYGHSGICAIQRAFGFAYTLGTPWPVAEFEKSDLIIIWGANPAFAGTPRGTIKQIMDARDRGATVITIKPALQPDAAQSDYWIPIRPGTDLALALAMLNVIISGQLYDKEFVASWCHGFEELREHVRQYTPEWASPVTGIPAERIREISRLYATAGAASILVGNAFDQTANSNNAMRAVASLIAITGNFDRPGGNVVPVPPVAPALKPVHMRERYTQEWVDKLVGPEIAPCFQPFIEGTSSAYYRCIDSVLTGKPYPVRTIIAPGTQPSVITRGTRRIIEALEKLDFFVVVDVMENASMPWADIVVPVASMYECGHPFEFSGSWLMARNKVVEPLGDYKSDYEFWLDLGVAAGYGDLFWNGDIEACMNYQLENFGISIDELRRHPEGIQFKPAEMKYEKYESIFSTPSPRLSHAPYLPQRKVALYNTTFEENGFNPLPEWIAPPEGPERSPGLLARYPLIFFDTHTSDAYNHGWLRNVPSLRELAPDPWIYIHPETARSRSIEENDWVIVESPHGWIKARAILFPGIAPDVVMGLHGWWQGCDELKLPGYGLLDGGANTNLLFTVDPDKAFDPVVTAMTKQTLVEVRRMTGSPAREES